MRHNRPNLVPSFSAEVGTPQRKLFCGFAGQRHNRSNLLYKLVSNKTAAAAVLCAGIQWTDLGWNGWNGRQKPRISAPRSRSNLSRAVPTSPIPHPTPGSSR